MELGVVGEGRWGTVLPSSVELAPAGITNGFEEGQGSTEKVALPATSGVDGGVTIGFIARRLYVCVYFLFIFVSFLCFESMC